MKDRSLFIENYLIMILCCTSFIITLALQITSEFIVISWFESIGEVVGKTLVKNESTFLTIASIFIGIYFTIYTLLGSIKVESTFASIRKGNFIKLVKFIKYSFVGSFVYLFYSLFNSVFGMLYTSAIPYLLIISGTLLLYMLLSALRLGIVVYLIYQKDLKKIHELIEQDKMDKQNTQIIVYKLGKYLQKFEFEEEIKQAEYMKQQIIRKHSEKSNQNKEDSESTQGDNGIR